MSILVDHKARKREIIVKSIRLFARDGYKDVTFQKLADNCGLARTALYRYFHNKRQIFDAAIFEASLGIVVKYRQILVSDASAATRLRRICTVALTALFENREFLSVIVDFVLSMERAGHDMSRPIHEHTIGLRRLIHSLVTEAVRRGEFLPSIDPDRATQVLYSQFEATVLRLTITHNADLDTVTDAIGAIIDRLAAPATGASK